MCRHWHGPWPRHWLYPQACRRPNCQALETGVASELCRNTHEPCLLEFLSDLDSHLVLDLPINGTDEVYPHLNLVKGQCGSFLREKMVEGAYKKFICIVDELKLLKNLGGS
ncbi:hypothetical protein ACFX15_039477 [Malus domestica]